LASLQDESQKQSLAGHMAAIRAYDAWVQGRGEQAAIFARQALENLPETESLLRGQAAITLGLALQFCDDLAGAERAFRQAFAINQQVGKTHVTLFTYTCLAYLHILRGQLQQSFTIGQQGLKYAETAGRDSYRMPVLGSLYAALSLVLSEWNETERALETAHEGVALALEWGQADTLHFARTCLIDVLIAAGKFDQAFTIIQQAKETAQSVSPWFEEITENQELELALAQGDLETFARRALAKGLQIDGGDRINRLDRQVSGSPGKIQPGQDSAKRHSSPPGKAGRHLSGDPGAQPASHRTASCRTDTGSARQPGTRPGAGPARRLYPELHPAWRAYGESVEQQPAPDETGAQGLQ
jgi:ATP/maltotriose-dependent transcriptional regulator MalT